jgi:hypothetical protein
MIPMYYFFIVDEESDTDDSEDEQGEDEEIDVELEDGKLVIFEGEPERKKEDPARAGSKRGAGKAYDDIEKEIKRAKPLIFNEFST